MLESTVNNLSELLGIANNIIPDIITILTIIPLLLVGLRGGLSWATVLLIYGISMVMLSILGLDSQFNLVTLIEKAFNELVDLIF